MSSDFPLEFRRFDVIGARELRETVRLIHDDAYAEAMEIGGEFSSTEAFMTRFDAYVSRSDSRFELVVGYVGGEPVGQTWGWPLGPASLWWDGLLDEVESGFKDEDGTRTFALSEIMVRRAWTGRGIAHTLHDELLRGRTERRATLLVDPANPTDAYAAYLKWGWHKVSRLRPSWPSAPTYDVLMLDLPLRTSRAS
ncbi:hypothetical protein EDD29_1208 [Actinocorallia herbida]|uniref:N-acetyltransferase domain-containing protein n=1 Tax=Actinocorallia herbida TaxID=58109 RepID=A0A3N1CQW4_9ACTN|nr:GNAT family N-acetyltransferase [Actinocorallia herbida]ROO83701.1 hypothetical protein EDD29_1208 [Actinocorallia herbida]